MELELELKNIDRPTADKVIQYLESEDYNEYYIYYFLEGADKKESPIDYIKAKFPDALKS